MSLGSAGVFWRHRLSGTAGRYFRSRSLLCRFNTVLGIFCTVFNSLCSFQRSVSILLIVSATAALLFQS